MSAIITSLHETDYVQHNRIITRDASPTRTVNSQNSDTPLASTPLASTSSNETFDSYLVHETPTSSKQTYGAFANQTKLEEFLLEHPKSKLAMMSLKTGIYGIPERQAITYVTAAKVIDVYGSYPPKEKLIMVSIYLASITGLKPIDFFEPKSHKGFLAKCIENSRCRLASNEKRWTWAPEKREKQKQKKEKALSQEQDSSSHPASTDVTFKELKVDDFVIQGCCREVEECEFCEGRNT